LSKEKKETQMVLQLRPFSLANDAKAIMSLLRDYDSWRYDLSHKFHTDESIRRMDSSHSFVFDGFTVSKENSKPDRNLIYGMCYLFQIDFTNRNAHFNFLCKNEHTRKLFFDLMMKYFFNGYGFHRIYCELEEDDPNHKFFTEMGMQICGKKSESRLYGCRYYNTSIFSTNDVSWIDSAPNLKLLA